MSQHTALLLLTLNDPTSSPPLCQPALKNRRIPPVVKHQGTDAHREKVIKTCSRNILMLKHFFLKGSLFSLTGFQKKSIAVFEIGKRQYKPWISKQALTSRKNNPIRTGAGRLLPAHPYAKISTLVLCGEKLLVPF